MESVRRPALDYRRLNSNIIVHSFSFQLIAQFHELDVPRATRVALTQRIGLAAVWIRQTGVVLCACCTACRGRESAIQNDWGGGLPMAVDSRDGHFLWVRRGGICGVGWQRGIGLGDMGRRSLNGRVGHHELARGWGRWMAARDWPGGA